MNRITITLLTIFIVFTCCESTTQKTQDEIQAEKTLAGKQQKELYEQAKSQTKEIPELKLFATGSWLWKDRTGQKPDLHLTIKNNGEVIETAGGKYRTYGLLDYWLLNTDVEDRNHIGGMIKYYYWEDLETGDMKDWKDERLVEITEVGENEEGEIITKGIGWEGNQKNFHKVD